MLSLPKLLRLQVFYYLLGLIFNAVSFFCVIANGQQLTPNEPILASVLMTVYAFFLIPGFTRQITLYRILMSIAVLIMGYGGVFKHIYLMSDTPQLYASFWAGAIGISINIFGLILNVIAASGKFNK